MNICDGCETDDECTTSDGVHGIVKRTTNCPQFLQQSRYSTYMMPCGFESIHPLVCCETEQTIEQTTTPEPTATTSLPLTTIATKIFDYDYDDILTLRFFTRPAVSQCTSFGKKPEFDDSVTIRVMNGIMSDLGEFPHFASLGYRKDDGGHSFDCGGALISENFVLSAAHCCIRGREPKIVRLGKVKKKDFLNKKCNPSKSFRLRWT